MSSPKRTHNYSQTSIRRSILGGATPKPKKPQPTFAPTGCTVLDEVVGGGMGRGFRFGSIVNIVGDKSSGKTFLACEIVAAAYAQYKTKLKWKYDDAESGFTFNTEKLYGVEIMPMDDSLRAKSITVEDLYVNVRLFLDSLKPTEKGIYVVDSLDGLSNRALEDRGEARVKAAKAGKDFEKGTYGMETPKFLSQEFFRTLTETIHDKNVLLIIISQTRDKINSMFGGQARSGGKALDFYAHTALWLSHLSDIKVKGRPVGAVVKAYAKKSKTPRPRREAVFSFLFDYGLDDIGSSVDFLFDLRGAQGELLKRAESISWGGDGSRKNNLVGLKTWMEEIGRLEGYRQDVRKQLKRSEVMEWIEGDPEIKTAYEAAFGEMMTRTELVKWVEAEEKEEELKERVRARWEEIEASIASGRKRKY